MSLLMKALEKASQDRKENDTVSASSARDSDNGGASQSELTIEPAITPQRKSATPPLSPTREAQQARTIIRAGQRDNRGIGTFVRERPILIIITLAIIFALGYSVFIYLQINPRVLAKQPSTPAAMLPPPSVSSAVATTTQPPPAFSLLPQLPSQNSVEPTPLAAKNDKTPTSFAPQTSVSEVPVAPSALRDTIKVTGSDVAPTLNPLAMEAYQAFESGDLGTAQQRYDQLLKSDPTNLDALLGLADIATKQDDRSTAAKHYMKALELDPQNAAAQAGLLNMFGGADPLAAESRLKQLIALDPSPFLYFTLGNIYADQQRWPDAQQAYFEAHHLQPDNPDYAYNLAVGLDHIGQPKLALEFYRLAVQLAKINERANFNIAGAESRIDKLQKAVQ
jgi:Tfp pilus assembly protein PilF